MVSHEFPLAASFSNTTEENGNSWEGRRLAPDTDILNAFFFFFATVEITAWPSGKIGVHKPALEG